VIPGGPADHLAQAIPVVAPLKLAVRKEAAENRSTARTPEQVARLLAAVSAENPRLSPMTGRPLAPRCSKGKIIAIIRHESLLQSAVYFGSSRRNAEIDREVPASVDLATRSQ
jgi:hypothetical protein